MKEKIESILGNIGFSELNPLQEASLEANKKGDKLLILSQTGSGKTFAFLLPMVLNLNPEKRGIQALILAPSRELALQIEGVFKSMKTNYKVLTCYGGHSMRVEANSLTEAPAVLIGTPGRICDHIDRETIDLRSVEQFVIDEYDKCLEFGFDDQMRFITERLTRLKKLSLVSATEMSEYPSYLKFDSPQVINFLGTADEPNIHFLKVKVNNNTKFSTLFNLLCSFRGELCIVFCNFREATESIVSYLNENAYEAIAYHGGMEQEERERALLKFRNGTYHTLICTDLGSRGLDIPEIQHVVHFQYPHNSQAYIHRNGRTARMKADGSAYLILNSDEQLPDYLPEIEEEWKPTKERIFPVSSEWQTLYFSGGKKDKINKIDLVGFLGQKGGLKKEDIGLITVMDFMSFVAVKRDEVRPLLNKVRDQKVKGKKLKIGVAR